MLKPLFITLGLVLTGLAVLGIFLPLLPTTPLLLLAVACFARSSEKLHDMIMAHRIFGPLIRQWHETRSMPRRAKLYALGSICAGGVVSFLSVDTAEMKFIMVAVLVIPVVIIMRIKTSQ